MTDPVPTLVLDLVEWVAARPRSYADVMEAWRTSCPRLTVWEDALDRGLLVRTRTAGRPPGVAVTPAGLHALAQARGPEVPRAGNPLSAAPAPAR